MVEKIIETRTCKQCTARFPITDADMAFYEKVSPVFGGVKYTIPAPTLCPECRDSRRWAFRNEKKLYKRKCDLTNKEIVSMYSSDKAYTIYHQDSWWEDSWNPMDYGQTFNFDRPFFDQFSELIHKVPQLGLFNTQNENSQYANFIGKCKNVYMSSVVWYDCEDIYYSSWIFRTKDVVDCFNLTDCTNCFECIDS